METLFIKDFSAGWCPSDDPVNGRPNALLKMDSLELDQNGAVTMTRGTKKWRSTNYAADAHSIYSKFISGTRYQYLALTDQSVYRDATSIISGGSATRACFAAAFDYVFIYSGDKRYRDSGAAAVALGITANSAPTVATNGAGVLDGDYEYAEMAVYNSGSAYYAKSALSTVSTVTASNNKIQVTVHAPTSPANETWVFRRGGTLDQWYRVKILTSSYTTPFDDNMADIDAEQLGITANNYLLPITSTNIPDAILDVVGLINGRMIMFTKKSIYFSVPYSPDTYDIRTTIDISASGASAGSELFLWARKVAENLVLVGTTQDVYLLGGTFSQQIDGTLDIYYRNLGVHDPPISYDACTFRGAVIYCSKFGWVSCSPQGTSPSLCFPNTDTLYRGNTVYSYGGIPVYIYPNPDFASVIPRYLCAVGRDKLWTSVPTIASNNPSGVAFSKRVEIYDFNRSYWRTMALSTITAMCSEDDGAITVFVNNGGTRNIILLDNPVFSSDDKTLLGPGGTKQTIKFLTTFKDNGNPRNRKDSLTLKFKINTNNEALTYNIYTGDSLSSATATGSITSSGLNEKQIDISSSVGTVKNWAFELTGTIGDFLLDDISLDYEPRPNPALFYRSIPFYAGPNKKRPRTWPLVIDTLGNDVTLTPYIDGSSGTTSTINTTGKRTALHFFKTDIFATDLWLTLSGNNPFELWNILDPEYVQQLPLARQFDQVGPVEFFRYSRIREIEFKIHAFSGTDIAYACYAEDTALTGASGTLVVTSNKETIVRIRFPKTIAGSVLRIELGPTSFNFHRLATRVLVVKTGNDADEKWVDLDAEKVV